MNHLERYQNGEYEQVWDELQEFGDEVNENPYQEQAIEVVNETMRRVRLNCEQIISRLQTSGYVFGTYPDGVKRSYSAEPLIFPSKEVSADCNELEAEAGPLPLSLKAFWEIVGAVDLVGMHPSWPDGLDPLVVDPPEGALAQLYDYDGNEDAKWFAALAPDDLHKDNVSGGDPYGLLLPNPRADFEFMYEPHNMLFVPYLRLAILKWGGFPGLEGRDIEFEPLEYLTADLVSF